ncbi:Hydroxylamine oxidoreductase (HAO) [uncultured Desulfatiglans sp.]|uniref:Hydroxylamine oxidoreductase (HAO) n=1 Tax=Uncultured Desulfatiglans sp. TaxID=1748965 RepID=A0A653A5D4_UNCDX|nr:Hydroxylamine oxidoreductase (HAO) [uncultured Desulfatiglans sp.]
MMKRFRLVAMLFGAAVLLLVAAPRAGITQEEAVNVPKVKAFRIERSMSKEAVACIECHKREHPGIFADWAASRHAAANITCLDCHQAESFDPDVSREHEKQYQRSELPYGSPEYKVPVAAAVTPKDCSRCHPDEARQYGISKHANTIEIIWKIDSWLMKGMNSEFERLSGCYTCHGTVLKVKEGDLDPDTWPNVGVGRINLDGSRGSCTSCHTRHRFSVMEARKPEACGQCHLGPDHPQIEIFMESKHGDIYTAFGDTYNWTAAAGTWTAGVDYRAPTCAACHMSGSGSVLTSHDVTERLAWETQAPLTVRPQDFAAFPAATNYQIERDKMKDVCKQCHARSWVDGHFSKFDRVVEEYNTVYYEPAKKVFDELYEKQLLDKSRYFDERLEVDFYELWHHEGRRARFGVAMMAPDYAWWHGFYECKIRFNNFMEEARHLIENNQKAYVAKDFPNATGSTEVPPEAAPTGR